MYLLLKYNYIILFKALSYLRRWLSIQTFTVNCFMSSFPNTATAAINTDSITDAITTEPLNPSQNIAI